jgi:hypothetical protein
MGKLSLFWLFAAAGMAGTIHIGFDSPDYFPENIKNTFDVQVTLAAGLEGSFTPRLLMPDTLDRFDSSWYFKSVLDALWDGADIVEGARNNDPLEPTQPTNLCVKELSEDVASLLPYPAGTCVGSVGLRMDPL